MAERDFTPFFDSMINQNLVDDNIFAFYMSMNPKEDDSELTFGYYDEKRFEAPLIWHPVIDKLFWSLRLNDIKIGNKSLGICQDEQLCLVTPDSGTSLSTMPYWAHKIFKQAVYSPRSPCELGAEQSFGNLTFVINGIDYPIPSHHWNQREIDETAPYGGVCSTTISELTIR